MGTIDARGVFIYDNTDQMVPHAAYMNLGQQSVSDALADLRTDLTVADTGWVTVTSAGGMTGNFQGRRIGSVVYLRGNSAPGLDWSSTEKIIVDALPTQFRPSATLYEVATTSASAGDLYFRVRIQGPTIGARASRTAGAAAQISLNLCYLGD